ncbi:hypothetical protein Tco_0470832 [Tanacetum coccineum]
MYRPSFDSSLASPQPNQGYSPINRINLDMDMDNLFDSQDFYAGQGSGQGSGQGFGLPFCHGNQDYYTSQDGSNPVEDDSPVEDVAPVKVKKVSKHASKAKKNDIKETSKPWTTKEEIALCKGWCDVSENSVGGNTMKNRGFWVEVIAYFEKETDETRQIMLLGKVLRFLILQEKKGNKKYKTSETTSKSTQGGFNLNDEADGYEEDIQEEWPIGLDWATKKASSSSHFESSSVVGEVLLNL